MSEGTNADIKSVCLHLARGNSGQQTNVALEECTKGDDEVASSHILALFSHMGYFTQPINNILACYCSVPPGNDPSARLCYPSEKWVERTCGNCEVLFVDIEGKKNGREEAVKQTRAGICQAHSLLHSLTLNADQFQSQSQNTTRGLKKEAARIGTGHNLMFRGNWALFTQPLACNSLTSCWT